MKNNLVREAIRAFNNESGCKAKYVNGHFLLGDLSLKVTLAVQAIDNAIVSLLNHDEKSSSIIVTRYVSPKNAQLLKGMDIAFIDLAGNAFINKLPLFIFVQGRPTAPTNSKSTIRAFNKTGLKVIFAFLCNPGLENLAYREIAAASGVALGVIGKIFEDLTDKGFLRKRGKKTFSLVNKEELLNRWVSAYSEQLKPGLLLGKYKYPKIRDYSSAQELMGSDFLWSGEIAGEILTNHLIAKKGIVYVKSDIDQLAIKLRLQKDVDGNIEVIKRFWKFETQGNQGVAPEILVYADLMTSGLERNIETAGKLYETRIKAVLT